MRIERHPVLGEWSAVILRKDAIGGGNIGHRQQLRLLDLVRAPPESPLGRVTTLLMRIENVSHILAWARADAAIDNGEIPLQDICAIGTLFGS